MIFFNGINRELYIPKITKIVSVKTESDLVKTYKLAITGGFNPGQFVQVSAIGMGEVPISISSSPTDKKYMELTVRDTGKVTGGIHLLGKDSSLGLRGPYGNSFPIENITGRNLIFVAGGIGLAPLRSLIRYVLANRNKYGHIYLLYGARTPDEMIFKSDIKKWMNVKNMDILLTVDKPLKGWKGHVGVVTELFNKIKEELKDYVAFVCGPSIMIKYVIQKLSEIGLKDEEIVVTLERYMKCGVGKCGHCYLDNKYVCTDGPVFTFKELKKMRPETIIT